MGRLCWTSQYSCCFPLRQCNGQSSREVEETAPNRNGSKLLAGLNLKKISLGLLLTKSSSLIAAQISAPVLSAPTVLLKEQNRWSAAPTVLGQTERQNRKIECPTRPLHPILFCMRQNERAPQDKVATLAFCFGFDTLDINENLPFGDRCSVALFHGSEKRFFMRFVFTYIHHLCEWNTLQCKLFLPFATIWYNFSIASAS